MRTLSKAVLGAAVALLAAGCSHSHVAGVATTPNPLPPPGYRAVCASSPTIFNGYTTRCTPVVAPIEHRVVIRAKG